jgi:hypothetical protein
MVKCTKGQGDAIHPVLVPQESDLLPGRRAPDPRCAMEERDDDNAGAVGREGGTPHCALVPAKGGDLLPRRRVPDPQLSRRERARSTTRMRQKSGPAKEPTEARIALPFTKGWHDDRFRIGAKGKVGRSSQKKGPRKLLAVDGRHPRHPFIADTRQNRKPAYQREETPRLPACRLLRLRCRDQYRRYCCRWHSTRNVGCLAFYLISGAQMFDRTRIIHRLQSEYKSEPLARELQQLTGRQPAIIDRP